MEFKYDVALSFAGEDREYVEKVAHVLDYNGIKVFYDKFESVDLWGKDLGIHFDFVYRKSAKYCVPFISIHYRDKVWTNLEIRTAIARAIESNEEYILPARFDDTELPGLRPTIGYINLGSLTPQEFAELLIKKISKEPTKPITQSVQKDLAIVNLVLNAILDERGFRPGASFSVNITNLNKEDRYFYEPVFIISKPFNGANGVYIRDKMNIVYFPIKLDYGGVTNVSYYLQPNSLLYWEKLDSDTTIKVVASTTVGESFESNIIEVKKIIQLLKS